MSTLSVDVTQNGSVKSMESLCSVAEIEERDFSRLLERPPRPLNTERHRSCDERSLSELSIGLSPHHSFRNADNSFRLMDHLDVVFTLSPGRRSGFNTPRSQNGFETHPMVDNAWEALRRSLVYFRGLPVGTIAALDSSEENLNYDQVNPQFTCYNVFNRNIFSVISFTVH